MKQQRHNMQELTPQEQKILDLLMEGLSPKEIGYRLNIVYDTVAAHQKKIYRKMKVNSLQELLVKCLAVQGTAVQGTDVQKTDIVDSAVQDGAKRKFPLLKVLIGAAAALVLALGLFLFLNQPKGTADAELSIAEESFPADFAVSFNETVMPWATYNFNPDVLQYEGKWYPSPFKLGEGNRLTEGDVYQLTCSFTPNVDINHVNVCFIDTSIEEDNFYTELSGYSYLGGDFKANTMYSVSCKLLIIRNASGASSYQNLLHIWTESHTEGPRTFTFHEFEVVKLTQKLLQEAPDASDLIHPLVFTFEHNDGINSRWSYRLFPDEILYEGERIPSPFKLGLRNRLTEGDIYQVNGSFTSNVDLFSLEFSFNWLSAEINMIDLIKAGVENNISMKFLILNTASGWSPAENALLMFVPPGTEEQPILTFTKFDVVKIGEL